MKKILLGVLALGCAFGAAAMDVKDGDKIVLMGDSITQNGWNNPSGYVRMLSAAFWANKMNKVVLVPCGISGHNSEHMAKRFERDVLKNKPQFLTLSCGVNDVWHPFLYPGQNKGIKLEDYKKNITSMVEQAQAANIKVLLLTSTMIKEDADSPENKALAPYNDFIRELAKEKNCVLVDLNAMMQKRVAELRAKTGFKHNVLTTDGVHMDVAGDEMFAEGIMRGLGFTDAEMKLATDAYPVRLQYATQTHQWLRMGQYDKLKEKADAAGLAVPAFIRQEYIKMLDALSK